MLFLTTEHRWPIAFTLGLSLQMDLMGTVNDTIKYRIGNGRFADNFRPFLHRNLAGNQDRLPAMTPLDNLQQVSPSFCGKALKAPVIKDQQPGFSHAKRHFRVLTPSPGI